LPIKPVVIGRSDIVGSDSHVAPQTPNGDGHRLPFKEKDLPGLSRMADILIAAIAARGWSRRDFVKPGATVIDVG